MNVFYKQLTEYETRWPNERETIKRFRDFCLKHPDCFERTLLIGHITGSGLVTNSNFSKVLLTHHKKLNKWLQFGGHSDGHPVPHETAMRECEEESGVMGLKAIPETPEIFDLDIHEIPARGNEPAHLHYDVRYLFQAVDEKFEVSDESHDVKWFSLDEAYRVTEEPSMIRQFKKLELMKRNSR